MRNYCFLGTSGATLSLACNSECVGFWWCGRWGCTTALHHCPIEPSSGSKPECGCHVCCTTLNRTNICKDGLKVKVHTLYRRWGIATPNQSWTSGCKSRESSIHKNWSSSPANKKSLGHCACVGYKVELLLICTMSTSQWVTITQIRVWSSVPRPCMEPPPQDRQPASPPEWSSGWWWLQVRKVQQLIPEWLSGV